MADTARGATEIRVVGEDELAEWGRAVDVGFLRSEQLESLELRRTAFTPGRLLGGYDGTRCVATFRSFGAELTVPGGAVVAANAITNATVTSTHRRQGLLTRMMRRDLESAVERGDAVAILIAAEYAIYGRFGFGPATRASGWQIDLPRTGGLRPYPGSEGGRIELVTMAEERKLGPELFDRFRRLQPGAIDRDARTWRLATGDLRWPGQEWKEPFVALHRDAEGVLTGLLSYSIDDTWDGNYPNCTLTVRDHFATDRATAAALWRHAFSVDWVRKVEIGNMAPDDPLPLLLADPRAAVATRGSSDFMWLRVLDVPAALGARTYGAPGRVVFQIADPLGHIEGRWALETAADGSGTAVRTEDPADLALDSTALGALYLGDETVPRLVAAGLVRELVPGAAVRADLTLRTPLRPWSPDGF